jgi:tRNA threonylcarbamoyladenosine modification (KEOPS) complex  Pcc1 subunit
MEVHCKILLQFSSEEQAQKIQQTVSIDDGSFVSSKINNNTLEASIKSNSLSSFLHTLDDYLACITVAENVMKKKHQ